MKYVVPAMLLASVAIGSVLPERSEAAEWKIVYCTESAWGCTSDFERACNTINGYYGEFPNGLSYCTYQGADFPEPIGPGGGHTPGPGA